MLNALRRLLTPPSRRPSRRRPVSRPGLECLEGRIVPSAVSWISPTSGDWSVGSNWSGGQAPGPNDDVTINQPGVTVTHSAGNDSVHSLTEGASSDIDLTGGSLGFSASFTVNGTLEVDGGTLNLSNQTLSGTGLVTNTANSSWTIYRSTITPDLENQGTLETLGGVHLQGTFNNDAGATLSVVGDGTGSYNFQILQADQGLTNDGTITMDSTQASFFSSLGVGSGTLVNAADGTIDILAGVGGTRSINGQLDNEGTLITNGALQVTTPSSVVNNGTILVENGDLTFNGSPGNAQVTNNGTFTIDTGRTLTVYGNNVSFFENSGGSVGGGGTFLLDGAGGTFSGDFATNGASLTLADSAAYTSTGTLTVSPGDTLTLYRGGVVNAALDNQGTVLAQGVDNQIDGDYTSEPGSTLRVSGDPANFNTTLTMANDFTNHGLIELTSSNGSHDASLNLGLRFNGGDTRTLTNAPDGTISAVAGTGGNRTLNANVENQGTISVASGTTLTIFYGGLNNLNNGTLSGGTYDVAGTFQFFNGAITTNDASLTLDGPAARVVDMSFGRNALTGLSSNTANGTLVFVDGATLTLPSFTNNGWFEVDDTSHVTVNGAYNDEGTTALGGGTLTASLIQIDIGALVTGTGTLDGDVYNKAGTLVVGSVGTPGILKVTGNYTQGSGADLYLEIGGTNAGTDFGLLQVGKKATLDGTLSVVLINGYTPPSGTRFQVMTYASESGEFATLDQDGTSFTPEYDATGLTLVAN